MSVALPADMPEWRRHLLTDPQTSGGLLVPAPPSAPHRSCKRSRPEVSLRRRIIGKTEAGKPSIQVV